MIYKVNNKGLGNIIRDFNKTTYGKCMFVICYIPFVFLFVLTIFSLIYFLCGTNNFFYSVYFLSLLFITLFAFSLGSFGYYKELRIFADKGLIQKNKSR